MAESSALIIRHEGKTYGISTEDLEQFELTEEQVEAAEAERDDVTGFADASGLWTAGGGLLSLAPPPRGPRPTIRG